MSLVISKTTTRVCSKHRERFSCESWAIVTSKESWSRHKPGRLTPPVTKMRDKMKWEEETDFKKWRWYFSDWCPKWHSHVHIKPSHIWLSNHIKTTSPCSTVKSARDDGVFVVVFMIKLISPEGLILAGNAPLSDAETFLCTIWKNR